MNRKVALVLSSGGARGIAHIGVIEALLDAGMEITSIAGTSMGSVVGGMYAIGKLPEYKEWLLQVTRMDIIKFMDLTIGHGGLVKGEKIVQVMEGFIGDVKIEDLPLPYAAVAVDIRKHREEIFTSGSLMKAIRASISIPTVFRPVSSDHSLLVDGGVLNPLPLDVVTRKPGDLLVAVNVNAPHVEGLQAADEISTAHAEGYRNARERLNQRWSELVNRGKPQHKSSEKEMGVFDIISESINLMQHRISMHSVEKHKPDLLINVSYKTANVFDFYKADVLIEAGRAACRNALKGDFL